MGLLSQLRRSRRNLSIRRRSRGPNDVRAVGYGPKDVVPALIGAWRKFVALLRSLDLADGPKRVPHLEWTVAETAAHVLTVMRRGVDTRRAATIEELGPLNKRCIEEVEERDLHHLADMIEQEISDNQGLLRLIPALWSLRVGRWMTLKLHAGFEADLPTALCYGLGDTLVHGYDVATAVLRPWVIEASEASIAVRAGLPGLLPFIRKEVIDGPSQRVAVVFPGGEAIEAAVGGGEYSIRPIDPRQADGQVDPVELLLGFSGRVPPTDPLASMITSWFGAI